MSSIKKWSDLESPYLESINLELTGHCNYKCTFCMNPQDDFREKGYISEELVNKIIKELNKNIKIHVCGIGEPSLHPKFIEIMRRLIDKFDYVSLVTNGTLFVKHQADVVDQLGIDKILFSLDYIDNKKYKKDKGGDLEKVFNAIKEYSDVKTNNTFLQINYLYRDFSSKEEILSSHKILSSILKNDWMLYIRQIKDLAGQIDIKTSQNEDELDSIFKDHVNNTFVVENWNRYLKDTNYMNDNPKICRHIYKYYMLLWNGDVVPCCQDFNAQLNLFNVMKKEYELQNLFTTLEYLDFFENMEKLNYDKYDICKKCKDYYRA